VTDPLRHPRLSQVGAAIPSFWLGLLFILFFAVELRVAAAGGFPGWERSAAARCEALLLPSWRWASARRR
jgi:peptide/nickel transport system permease protein